METKITKSYTVKMSLKAHEQASFIKNRLTERGEKSTLNDAIVKAIEHYKKHLEK
ncbi:MAG: hypothetical protein PF486_06555 [Prolixibacteraceae bacterium]|jgi:hypothetical protein|nr:hypothetical protein [Prolixibacteraceae bacterium]